MTEENEFQRGPAVDFTEFQDARVKLTFDKNEDGNDITAEEILVVMAVNVDTQVLMVRPKGKTMAFLVDFSAVHAIELDEDTLRVLKQKSLRPIKLGDARQHLVDRHGWPLEQVNALNEVDALKQHDEIDHSILGHAHAEPVETNSTDSAPAESVPSTDGA